MANTLTITVTDLFSDSGKVLGSIYNSESSFPNKGEQLQQFMAAPDAGSTQAQITVSNLPDGQYAIALFQDLNGNGKLDQNFFGVPTEPIGFSNNTFPKLRKPTWDECVFTVDAGNLSVSVQLYKMLGA